MDITLNLLSSLSWQIFSDYHVSLPGETLPNFGALLDAVFDLFPSLDASSYKLYWQCAPRDFFAIRDFASHRAFENLAAGPDVYLLVADGIGDSQADMGHFLRGLDAADRKTEKERNRDKYDVRRILGKEESEDEEEVIEDNHLSLMDDVSHREILNYALSKKGEPQQYYTADLTLKYNLVNCAKKAMKGRIINCSAHKDIYFLEANAKTENRNMENLFASPAGREMFKCKPRSKLKQKLTPTIDFITNNRSRQSSPTNASQPTNCQEKCIPKTPNATIEDKRKSSIDLYEEAASILGLTCAQTDDCKCIECQCHYFDFEEEIDFPTGSDCLVDVDHSTACSIQ